MTPIECIGELPGWRLHFCRLRAEPGCHDGTMRLAIGGTLATFHGRFARRSFDDDEVVLAVRRLLRRDGVDLDERPPSSEVLARRLLAGGDFPGGSAADALCRLLMLKTLVPWCVTDYSCIKPPLRFRRGREGESFGPGEHPVTIAGWPVLVDANRPVGSPLAGELLDPVGEADEVLLTCFQPTEVAGLVAPKVHLARFVVMTWAFRFVEERAVEADR